MRDIKRLFLLSLSVILLLSILTACSKKADNSAEEALSIITPPPTTETPAPTPTPTPEATPAPTPYNGPINPLTGEECEEDYNKIRPYAVMINNIEIATPQSGISKADIVYECLAEGGITRNLAIYQDIYDVGVVGSIRSARMYFVDIADSYDAIFIHAGSSPTGYSEIDRTGIQNIDGVNGASDIFYRDKARKSRSGYEHSLMFNSSLLPDFEIKYKLNTAHEDDFRCNLTFTADGTPANGGTANDVCITFSGKKTSFTYNPEDRLYYAYEYGSEYTDIENGVQLTFTNVVALKTSVSAILNDDKGRIETVTTGTGTGYFICGGKYAEINWSREEGGQFVYTLKDGTKFDFGIGKSYIAIIPSEKTVSLS